MKGGLSSLGNLDRALGNGTLTRYAIARMSVWDTPLSGQFDEALLHSASWLMSGEDLLQRFFRLTSMWVEE